MRRTILTRFSQGGQNCQTTEKNVVDACAELNLPADITHFLNVAEFLSLGVTRTPAVLVDGEIVIAGRVTTVQDLVTLLSAKRSRPAVTDNLED